MTPSASISALTTAIRRRRFIRLKQGPWSECQISDWLIFVAISPDVIDCFVLASSCISLRLELAWCRSSLNANLVDDSVRSGHLADSFSASMDHIRNIAIVAHV